MFTPRLNDNGMLNNPYWYSRNPFYPEYGLPNCTCYCWGRFWECSDPNVEYINRPTLSLANAREWYGYTADGYQRGQTPQLGAVMCFDGGVQGLGHVCTVEEIYSDGSVLTSNSADGGTYFYLDTYPPDYSHSVYRFQGFIYNPYVSPTPPVPPTTSKPFLYVNKRKFMKRRGMLWR